MEQTNTTVGTSSATILDISATVKPVYILIQNTHASNLLYVRLDGTTATAANGIRIDAGKALPVQLPKDMRLNKDITAISDAAGTTVIIAYGD